MLSIVLPNKDSYKNFNIRSDGKKWHSSDKMNEWEMILFLIRNIFHFLLYRTMCWIEKAIIEKQFTKEIILFLIYFELIRATDENKNFNTFFYYTIFKVVFLLEGPIPNSIISFFIHWINLDPLWILIRNTSVKKRRSQLS